MSGTILGIATMTDSAAALLRDGVTVAAAEEERLSRVKHQGGFPHRAIRSVLEEGGLALGDIDEVAVYWNPWRIEWRLFHAARLGITSPGRFLSHVRRGAGAWTGRTVAGSELNPDGGWAGLFRLRQAFRTHFGSEPRAIRFVDHHESHAASAFFGSDFPEAALLVLDGSGEAACTSVGVASGVDLRLRHRHRVPHSLGHYYSAVTGFLGFSMLDGEYKVMGMSPYGDPSGARWIRRHWLRSTGPGRYRLEAGVLDYHRALAGDFRGTFVRHFGPPRAPHDGETISQTYMDVAAAAQKALEEVVLDIARDLRKRTGHRRLAVAGGVALNCVALGRILEEGIFDELYVPPAPHDAGAALGAAMLRHARRSGHRPAPVRDARLGHRIDDSAAIVALEACAEVSYERAEPADLPARVARRLAEGEVVAWARERMEFGPRALGARSFLASPLLERNREILNEKIKKREPFRPFAPSVLAERTADYFELRQPSPFMSLIVPVRSERASSIPAVTHVDRTARPQTVERDVNPLFWSVLHEFEALTGVPVILNTSFNIQEPIVCSAGDALETFLRSGADVLVLGDYWVERSGATCSENA